jgi:hypothetical protein
MSITGIITTYLVLRKVVVSGFIDTYPDEDMLVTLQPAPSRLLRVLCVALSSCTKQDEKCAHRRIPIMRYARAAMDVRWQAIVTFRAFHSCFAPFVRLQGKL